MKKSNLKLLLTLVASLTLAALILAACGDPTATTMPPTTSAATTAPTTTTSSATTSGATTAVPTITPAPATTTAATQTTTGTTVPPTTASTTVGPFALADVNKNLFIDDRSNPIQLIRSYYNAINRHEYVRAYGYWNGNDQPYPDFEKGFATTVEVKVSIGTITGGAAAGTTYFSLPFALSATDTAGKNQMYVGFYETALSTPSNYGAPPILPMHINKAVVQPLTMTNPADQLKVILQSGEINRENPVTIIPDDGQKLDASIYLDSRSTPQEVLRSYYNAINRKEYVRAYSYWQNNSAPYAQFEKGFATTANVQLSLGQVSSDAGAGQLYSKVPVVVVSRLTGDKVQTFVGCYTLHQAQPAVFGAPPFQPMGIASADIKEVPATTNTSELLAQSCK